MHSQSGVHAPVTSDAWQEILGPEDTRCGSMFCNCCVWASKLACCPSSCKPAASKRMHPEHRATLSHGWKSQLSLKQGGASSGRRCYSTVSQGTLQWSTRRLHRRPDSICSSLQSSPHLYMRDSVCRSVERPVFAVPIEAAAVCGSMRWTTTSSFASPRTRLVIASCSGKCVEGTPHDIEDCLGHPCRQPLRLLRSIP